VSDVAQAGAATGEQEPSAAQVAAQRLIEEVVEIRFHAPDRLELDDVGDVVHRHEQATPLGIE
jgi:hypothetical protein